MNEILGNWGTLIGNVATAVAVILTVAGAAWKFVNNHLKHMEARLKAETTEMRRDMRDMKACFTAQSEGLRMDFLRSSERAREDLAQHTANEQQFFGERMGGMERDIREIRERLMRGA